MEELKARRRRHQPENQFKILPQPYKRQYFVIVYIGRILAAWYLRTGSAIVVTPLFSEVKHTKFPTEPY